MAKNQFLGFKQVIEFGGQTPEFQNGFLYVVRTDEEGKEGYVYFNGKKYGTNAAVDALKAYVGEIPSGATAETVIGYIQEVLENGVEGLDATVSGASEDGHVSVEVVEENGLLTAVSVATDDIASAQDLEDLDEYIKGDIQEGEDGEISGGIEKRVEALEQINAEADFTSEVTEKDEKDFVTVVVAEDKEGKLTETGSSLEVVYAEYDSTGNTITDGIATGEFVGAVVDDKLGDIVADLDAELEVSGNTFVNGSVKEENGLLTEFVIDESKLAEKIGELELADVKKMQINKGTADEPKYDLELLNSDDKVLASLDATEFIVDGMLSDVTYDVTAHTMTFTWNTDSGKDTPVVVNLDDIISPYHADEVTLHLDSETNTFSAIMDEEGGVASHSALTALEEFVGELPEATSATTVIGYVDEKVLNAMDGLDKEDEAVEGQYVSAVSQKDGVITVERADLPQLSVSGDSEDYLSVDDHVIAAKVTELGDAVKMTKGEDGKYSATDEEGVEITSGLANAADVAHALVEDEKVIAAALNDLNEKLENKNVTASGDTYVSAVAEEGTNHVVVSATQETKDSLALADTAIQSVNGHEKDEDNEGAIVLDASDIAMGADMQVSGETVASATATTFDVLENIFEKLNEANQAAKVSSSDKSITVQAAADGGQDVIVNKEEATDDTIEAGHIELQLNSDGALFGVMYYDTEETL